MNSVLLTPNPKSRSTGESDSGKVCIIHKHGRANYGTIQTLTIKRWEKIQEIKDIRSNAGFRKKSGTREAIFCLKVITETYLEMRKEL